MYACDKVHCTCMQEGAAGPRPFDMGWMAEFVDELSEFDRRMNSAVTDSGLLRHVPQHALFKAGAQAALLGCCPTKSACLHACAGAVRDMQQLAVHLHAQAGGCSCSLGLCRCCSGRAGQAQPRMWCLSAGQQRCCAAHSAAASPRPGAVCPLHADLMGAH